MPQKTLNEYLVISPVLLFFRRHINFLCLFLFLFYTKGYAFYALRVSYTILMVRHWGKDNQGQPYGPRSPEYQELYSVYNMDVLAGILCAAVAVIMIGIFLVWVTDVMGSYKSMMSREARHMRYWARQETRSLEEKGRLITTLEQAQSSKEAAFETIERMEALILRYEKSARALKPDAPKRTKLSDTEESFKDLFSQPAEKVNRTRKAPPPSASIKFKNPKSKKGR